MKKHSEHRLSRREMLKLASAGVVGYSLSGWLETLAECAADNPQRRRSCILLWMNGGPSQMETFDPKPGQTNGGPTRDIQTAANGIRISEHLPQVARHIDRMAIVRSMQTREADHGRATYLLRTGHVPGGPIRYPVLGSLVAKELERRNADLPSFVSIAPFRFLSPAAYGSGFLGPRFAPLIVGENRNFGANPQGDVSRNLRVEDLQPPGSISTQRAQAREGLLAEMEEDFLQRHPGTAPRSHRTAYERAIRMMRSTAVRAFNLEEETAETRNAYGQNLFGQGCLLARRLVERGVPFVEVSLNGWDTHQNNFDRVRTLCGTLDAAWSKLMADLQTRGLLDSTLIVWMGEFGRTPRINNNRGRDHWANSWSTVLAGGGIRGGQAVGRTSADGRTIENRPVTVPDLLATVGRALGINIRNQNMSNVGRPIRFVDPTANPINEVLA